MERDFKQWLALFRTSIANYQYYTYFDKVFSNVDAIKVELNIMNSLIGSKNIENDFDNLLSLIPQHYYKIFFLSTRATKSCSGFCHVRGFT